METSLTALTRIIQAADCAEKALTYKWLAAAEAQTGGIL